MPPDDFFDDDWEEPSRTQDTAITRPSGEPAERPRGGASTPPSEQTPRTQRPPQRRRPTRRGGARMPKMPKIPRISGGGAATLPPLEYRRLAALGLGILVVVLVLVLLARSCSGTSAKTANDNFVSQTLTPKVLNPSDDVAARFHKTLTMQRGSLGLLRRRFTTQLDDMRKVLATAEGLKPTKQLAPYQAALVQAIQYRVTGLQCMTERLAAAWSAKQVLAAGSQLYQCTGQLYASDYVYADSFASGADAALKQVGASGVPTSQFVKTTDIALVTKAGIGAALKRLHPGPVTGIHGTQIGSVIASPQNLTLQPGTLNQVHAKNLKLVVSVKNSGNFIEAGVQVQMKLKLASGGQPIVKTATIPSIAKGATQTVTFPGLFASSSTAPKYSVPYKVTVTSLRVPGEHNLSNNTATYSVEFLLS